MCDVILYLIPLLALCGVIYAMYDEIKVLYRKMEAQERFIEMLEKRYLISNSDILDLEERIEELENKHE